MSNEEDLDWMYDIVLQIIRSPEFRNPIKDFIDDNCNTFIGLDENTFEQGALHKQFVQLIDNLLDTLTKDLGITEEMFCHAAKKGLNEPKAKKYFEQLISFTNYNYFKNLMTKRNFQLEELAYKQMMADKNNGENEEEGENDEELEQKRKEMEENELQCALKMSLAAEEEKKKLEELEDEELQRAIKLSLSEQQAKPEPSPIVQMQPEPQKNPQPQPPKKEPKKEEPKKMEEIIPKESEKKLNPVDKVALKQKMLLEHDQKMKNLASQKLSPLPNFSAGNESLNKKLNELEQNKAKKLQEYREMILKMKKEKRQKEENEVDDILKVGGTVGTGGEVKKMTEEEEKKLNLRKQLADKLKAKLNLKK